MRAVRDTKDFVKKPAKDHEAELHNMLAVNDGPHVTAAAANAGGEVSIPRSKLDKTDADVKRDREAGLAWRQKQWEEKDRKSQDRVIGKSDSTKPQGGRFNAATVKTDSTKPAAGESKPESGKLLNDVAGVNSKGFGLSKPASAVIPFDKGKVSNTSPEKKIATAVTEASKASDKSKKGRQTIEGTITLKGPGSAMAGEGVFEGSIA
jgi:hypothetical protein